MLGIRRRARGVRAAATSYASARLIPMKNRLFRRIRSITRLNRAIRNGVGTVPRLERLEDRVVPTGPGTWSTFTPGGGSPRWGAPIVTLGPL
jgi:hypothetical protein